MISFLRLYRQARRVVLGRRRLLAALFAAAAVATGVRAATAPPAPATVVLTAARDLPSGTVLRGGDLRPVEFQPASVPSGTLAADELVGRTTAGPMRAGEPVTDVRLVRGSLLDGYPGRVLAPVRVADGDSVRLLRAGDRIDLLAADPEGKVAEVVAEAVPVVSVPEDEGAADGGLPDGGGALVLVAVDHSTAGRLAQSAVSSYVSVVLRRYGPSVISARTPLTGATGGVIKRLASGTSSCEGISSRLPWRSSWASLLPPSSPSSPAC
jgi:Flp pilus assembly protein CpaB